MQTQYDQSKDMASEGKDQTEGEFIPPFGKRTSLAQQANCEHDWQMDGQTLTSVRWTCSKCFKTEMGGLEI